ncbi:G-protein coupled receptor 15-like [Rhincodon typus]|uniref:G-protein coupled receptor 15-like n=1 Tax=Rhincodon typus TaxID=259920 RepID=UPI00202E1C26|nr:G-protein coupled receptor 15-like [Rhincodon typus]
MSEYNITVHTSSSQLSKKLSITKCLFCVSLVTYTFVDITYSLLYRFLLANLSVIIILSREMCGLSKCIVYYLVSMAVTDILVIITAAILNRIVGIYFPTTFLSITPACSANLMLIYGVRDSSVWVTVTFTFDRFIAICCQKLKMKYCTKKVAAVVIATACTLNCIRNIPLYFAYEPSFIINDVPWYCSLKSIYYTSPFWVAFDWLIVIFNPCLPFILILLLNVLTVRHIVLASRARRRLRTRNNGEKQNDPEMEKRRKSIVLLFAISGSFLLSYLLVLLTFLCVQIANVTYFSGSNYNESNFILDEGGYMLQLLNSCINPFIYAGTQSKFREQLKKLVKFPLTLVFRKCK